ncbi:MAG: NAD-dependent epimerase/dehydratase family protein, partial [Janthinobacterium lividum]
ACEKRPVAGSAARVPSSGELAGIGVVATGHQTLPGKGSTQTAVPGLAFKRGGAGPGGAGQSRASWTQGILDPMPTKPLPPSDLAEILELARTSFEGLRGARVFLTGGTGFFGHWLLESLLYANRELHLELQCTVLTRDAAAFRAKSPHITENTRVTLLEGDIRSFTFPTETHTHIVHAATDSGGQQAQRPAYELAESILEGTRRVLQFAQVTGAKRLLYTSTGAVYGRSTTLPHTPETYLGAPDPLQLASSYDEAKRMAEHLCIAYAHASSLEPVIARCFAFVGPHLPLDAHFAIGNFLGAAIRGEQIHIKGDGTPRRSWLYMSDLAAWLWTLLVQAEPNRAYNVGSGEAFTIAEAAQLAANTLRPDAQGGSSLPIQIDGVANPAAPLNSYVPDIHRVRGELGLQVTVPLAEGLKRTASWHSRQAG